MHFYKPEIGWAADVIPFFWEGEFHLFYLRDLRDDGETGTPWEHIGTRDFVHFTEYPQAIPRGGIDEQDRWIYTGCVIRAPNEFQIYYTGHNTEYLGTGRPQEAIMRATSQDLITWTKDASWGPLFADQASYEVDDWRDPFVFWNEEAGEYWMVSAARLLGRSARRAGCLALATSRDLDEWTMQEPFWAPGLFTTHECPDLFRIGEWWYLIYSEYSDRTVTRYRMSRELSGPWLSPPDDALDTRAFYAAKSVSDGVRRFLCGWNPTRKGETDSSPWQWGGNLVFHEIVQGRDGVLELRPPDSVRQAFERESRPVALGTNVGDWQLGDDGLRGEAGDGRIGCTLGVLPESCLISLRIRCSTETVGCGVLLRTDEALENGYEVRWEPGRSRIVVDRWPRARDVAFEFERPLMVGPGEELELRIFVDGTMLEVYANDSVALSYRMYDHPTGQLGLFCVGGSVTVTNLAVTTP